MQDNLSEEALLSAVKELIAIKSTADNPAGLRAAYDYMRDIVLSCNKDITIEEFESNGKPSFLAYRGEQRPKKFQIILNAHVDVVPGKSEQYQAFIKDGKLYGRGAYDMKAAAVVLAQVFCEFVDKASYGLALQVVTDEENSGAHGTLHQIKQGIRGDFVICGECGRSTDSHEIANEAKGIAVASLGFRGSSTHGAYPWKGDNAALKALRFTQLLYEKYPAPTEATTESTFTITSVDATSDAYTKTPDLAVVNVDARYAPSDPNFRSKAHFAALIGEIDPNAEILKLYDFSSPIYTSPHNPSLLSLLASAEKIEGAEFSLVRRNGTSDGRHYGDVGCESCEFGIAGEHQHGDDEYITLEAFRNYLDTMRDFLGKTIAVEQYSQANRAFSA